jgi:hypothetical protein
METLMSQQKLVQKLKVYKKIWLQLYLITFFKTQKIEINVSAFLIFGL